MIGLLYSFQVHAGVNAYIIDGYRSIPEFDYQIELLLQTNNQSQRLILDCQSFVNGLSELDLVEGEWRLRNFFMISGNNCEEVFNFSLKSFEMHKPFCLKLNFGRYTIDYDYDLSRCL